MERATKAILVVAVGALLLAMLDEGAPSGAVTATVIVQGPGEQIWNGSVLAQPATAYDALLAAADAGGFAVIASGAPGAIYVESIAGVANGWCVQVDGRDSPRSTDRFAITAESTVRWYWTEGACDQY